MKARIIKIGNSHGLRVPKALLEQTGLKGEVELEARNGTLIVRPKRKVREGWEEAAAEMHRRGDDRLLDPPTPTVFDETEWEW